MDVFDLRNQLLKEYEAYISSFINIQDARIKDYVDEQIASRLLWPHPLIQLNPSFQPANTIDELVNKGDLHLGCGRIFRIAKGTEEEKTMLLHQHQEEAVRAALSAENYILTTGSGSGKSPAYIV